VSSLANTNRHYFFLSGITTAAFTSTAGGLREAVTGETAKDTSLK